MNPPVLDPAVLVAPEENEPTTISETELRALFDLIDLDGSGDIDADEFLSLLHQLGLKDRTLEDVERMMMEVDEDGNGEIDFDEFKVIATTTISPQRLAEVRKEFETLIEHPWHRTKTQEMGWPAGKMDANLLIKQLAEYTKAENTDEITKLVELMGVNRRVPGETTVNFEAFLRTVAAM